MRRLAVNSMTIALLLAAGILIATRLVPVLQDWWITEPWTRQPADGVVLSARVIVHQPQPAPTSTIVVLDFEQDEPEFHGPFTRTEDGRVRVHVIYQRGRVDGPLREWNKVGELVLEARAVHGYLEGPSWARVRDGEYRVSGQWRAGKPVGQFIMETLDGRVVADCRFDTGLATMYREDGEIDSQFENMDSEWWEGDGRQYEHQRLAATVSIDFNALRGSGYRERPPFILPDGDTRDAVYFWPWSRAPKRAAGRYVNGRATGRWQFWLTDGIPSRDLIYEKGEIVSGTRRESGDGTDPLELAGVRYRELEWAEGELRSETWHLRDGSRRVFRYVGGERVSDLVINAESDNDLGTDE